MTEIIGALLLKNSWILRVRGFALQREGGRAPEVGAIEWIRHRFGYPAKSPSDYLYDPDIAPEEKRDRVEQQMREIHLRLEALKTSVDVDGRRG